MFLLACYFIPLLTNIFHFLKQQINKSSVAPYDIESKVQSLQPDVGGLPPHGFSGSPKFLTRILQLPHIPSHAWHS